jgi:galactonate dehydratase
LAGAARAGGITEFRKLTAMAESHFIPVAPHNPNGPVCLAAYLYTCRATSNFTILEEGGTDPVVCRELFGSWQDRRSLFLVSQTSGLGLNISDTYVRQHKVSADLS